MLMISQRNNSREDIECPGDTISYTCSVQSNSETVQLRWLVTFPGQEPIMTPTYSGPSDQDVHDMNITTRILQYRRDEFISSEIVLTVLQNVSMNGTILECRSENLSNSSAIVTVNTMGMFDDLLACLCAFLS